MILFIKDRRITFQWKGDKKGYLFYFISLKKMQKIIFEYYLEVPK